MYAPAQTKAFKGTCGTYHQVTLNGQILGYVRSWEKGRFGIEQTLRDQPSNFWHGGFRSKALATEAVCKEALLALKKLAAAFPTEFEHVFHVGDLVDVASGKDKVSGQMHPPSLGYVDEVDPENDSCYIVFLDKDVDDVDCESLTYIRETNKSEEAFFSYIANPSGIDPKKNEAELKILVRRCGQDIQERYKTLMSKAKKAEEI
jgi:hypothetical protein